MNTIRWHSAAWQCNMDAGIPGAGPTHPPQQGTHHMQFSVSSKLECDSIVLFCLCHRGHVMMMLLHFLFVNIVGTN